MEFENRAKVNRNQGAHNIVGLNEAYISGSISISERSEQSKT
jgi:hypothetical protein